MDPEVSAELFPHVRIVMGTVIGLGITRLLMTVAGIIQHPHRGKISALHMLWIGSMLLELVLFWWWVSLAISAMTSQTIASLQIMSRPS